MNGLRARLLNSTTLVFVAIVTIIVVWIGSGVLTRGPAPEPQAPAERVPTVAASWSEAGPVTREISLYGDVEPNQIAMLRARTEGIVEEVVASGTRVTAGEAIGQLSTDDRQARLARSRAQLASAQRDYDSAMDLVEGGFVSRSEAQTRLAELEAARADLRAIELEIDNTTLRAPIDGVVNRVESELGSYVAVGGEVLQIVDNDPLIAVVHVHQAAAPRLRTGMDTRVRFIGGGQREGSIRFIAPIADATTRTFRVEVEIDNSDGALPSGLSAEVIIPTDTVDAHRVSAALIRLDAQGRIGLQTVDDENRIAFTPVDIVRARADGIWVTGLPERARIVTISQGMLSPGQIVDVRETPEDYLNTGREPR
ncbi:efflux RND transporter periplasmic adaptor subunit [Aquisalimonas asiatica]|uniref:Membrane fusion protein, multidrug efflux system n=1 Tax=Aquisalimonas asiatica TaxID=406100 RepID=A0A1H8V6A3_9GAMM|nr:efflux RND transporter periplasmic adaptor subunit [Aquisalimonas asiatica]SEP11002.1 membrane fusion protein, multidrug efflux system [Aquisalimonas asiatica]